MRIHHVLIILILTFIQGHTDLNHENNKCLIISETFQAMPIKSAVKIVQLEVYIIFSILMTLTFSQGHNCVSNQTHFKLLSYGIQTWHGGRLQGIIICSCSF